MNFKRMIWGAILVFWAFACLAWVSIPWAIAGTAAGLLLSGMVVYFFWTKTGWEMFVFGGVLWWLVIWASHLGANAPVVHLINPSGFGAAEHVLGTLLTGLTALVTWKIGESRHAKNSPKDFNHSYLEGLRKS